MDMNLNNPLSLALREEQAPQGLVRAICARIALARQQNARRKTLLLGIASIVFGISLVPAFQYAAGELYASGFYEYMSLIFSDSGLVLSVWRQFAFSLIESIPSLAILVLLALCGALGWSLRRAFINARTAFSF